MHSFMTPHPWKELICVAKELEAMDIGKKSFLFQGGSDSWLMQAFPKVAKWSTTVMLAQNIFKLGMVKLATKFEIFRDFSVLLGFDFVYM
jgi:hypothetical protein